MALGFKLKKVQFNNNYTLEALFDAIKDTDFEAGRPEMVKHGLAYVIAFPALDSQNQVQILPATMKKESNSYQVIKMEQAGMNNLAKNSIIDKLTGGLFGIKRVAGNNAQEAERLVVSVAEQLEKMGL